VINVERDRLADLVRQPAAASPAAAGFLAALERDQRREFESGTTSAEGLLRAYTVKLETARRGGVELVGTDDLLRDLAALDGARIRIFATEDAEYAYVLFTDEEVTRVVACFAIRKARP
jgi:hypothetical protein